MTEKPTISEYLAALGNTPNEIAMTLRMQGIKGKRKSKRYGVISNAINTQCRGWGGLKILGKQDSNGDFHYRATYGDLQIIDPRLPQVVQDFLGLFDQGKYPELVASEVKTKTEIVWD